MKVISAVKNLPPVRATIETVPDSALVGAALSLSIIALRYLFEVKKSSASLGAGGLEAM